MQALPATHSQANAAATAAQAAQSTPQNQRATTAARGSTAQGVGPFGTLPATAAKQAALNRLTAQAPALKQSVVQHAFIPQAAKGLAMALKQGEGTVTINLKPAHLGSLKIEVSMEQGEVTAKLEASSETARQLLTDAQHSLRAALEARGLSVERIDIVAPPSGAPSQDAADKQPDHTGEQATGEHTGRHTGGGAEAHTGEGRGQGRQGDIQVHEPWPAAAVEVSFALEQGGVYRLHLDAVA